MARQKSSGLSKGSVISFMEHLFDDFPFHIYNRLCHGRRAVVFLLQMNVESLDIYILLHAVPFFVSQMPASADTSTSCSKPHVIYLSTFFHTKLQCYSCVTSYQQHGIPQ